MPKEPIRVALAEDECRTLHELIDAAWKMGGVRDEKIADTLKALRRKIPVPPPLPPPEVKK